MYLALLDCLSFGGSLIGTVAAVFAGAFLWAVGTEQGSIPASAWPLLITSIGAAVAGVIAAWTGNMLKFRELDLRDVPTLRADFQRLESLVQQRFATPLESLATRASVQDVRRQIEDGLREMREMRAALHDEHAECCRGPDKAPEPPDAVS